MPNWSPARFRQLAWQLPSHVLSLQFAGNVESRCGNDVLGVRGDSQALRVIGVHVPLRHAERWRFKCKCVNRQAGAGARVSRRWRGPRSGDPRRRRSDGAERSPRWHRWASRQGVDLLHLADRPVLPCPRRRGALQLRQPPLHRVAHDHRRDAHCAGDVPRDHHRRRHWAEATFEVEGRGVHDPYFFTLIK